MSERKDIVTKIEDSNKQKENNKEEEPSNIYSIIFRILLIIHICNYIITIDFN